ncbi:MAG: putative rane protein [Firmicutes bacterium]|nr:putative rane protein [Bacillota bacterium]
MSIVVVVMIRSFTAFFILLLFVRLMGKQQVAQLTFFDYVVGITIGSIASTLSVQANENLLSTSAGLATWTVLAILLAYLSMHNMQLRKILDGQPTVVIENGKILEANLRQIRIPTEELLSELRTLGVFNIADIEFAMFEPSGKISIQKKSQKQPLTPSDLNVPTQYDGLPTNLVMDGVLLESSLKSLNLTKAWLHFQLGKKNIQDVSEISLAQLDTKGNLFIDLKGDKACYIIPTNG